MLINDAAPITGKQVAAYAPLPTGGAVTNGTYHLVDLTLYTGPGGAAGPLPLSIKQTIAIQGASANAISEVSGKSEDATSTFVTFGSNVTLGRTCPGMDPPQTATFSATPTSLVMFIENGAGQTVGYTYEP